MRNLKVVALSIAGLICMGLTFTIDWLFIIPAAIFSAIGWKILLKK